MQHQKNEYEILVLPIEYNKSFFDLSGEEIASYYQWFLKIKGERLKKLCEFLFRTQGICLKESNLNVIEIFMLNSITVFAKPKDQINTEMGKVPSQFKPFVFPADYVLDKKTISVCYDIGIFLGELIISLDNKIKWELETNDEYSDFGQPVLTKRNSKLSINPFTVTKNMATKIYEGRYSDGQIISAFNAWKKGFKVSNVSN